MYHLAGTDRPWSRRLDHLICEVPDIEEAYSLFLSLGFPSAWPVGPFWPGRRTAGIALGGVNLELVQPDDDPPSAARIRTVVFEPTTLADVRHALAVDVQEKWEDDPDLLRLRGFDETEVKTRQLICRNAYPLGDQPISFFFCEYAPRLRERLAPQAFPNLPPVIQVTLSTPHPATDWRVLDRAFGLPASSQGVDIALRENPGDAAEVVELRIDRGPIDLVAWPTRFQFI